MQSLNAEFYTYGKARPARVDKQGKRRWIVTVRGGKTGNTRYFLADSDDDKGYAWTTRLHKARSFYSWDGAESRLRSLRKKYPGSDKLKRAKRQVAAGRVSAEHHKKRRTKKSATKKRATKKRASKRRTTKKNAVAHTTAQSSAPPASSRAAMVRRKGRRSGS